MVLPSALSSLTTPLAAKLRKLASPDFDDARDSATEFTHIEISQPESTAPTIIPCGNILLLLKDSAEVRRGRSRRFQTRFGPGIPRRAPLAVLVLSTVQRLKSDERWTT